MLKLRLRLRLRLKRSTLPKMPLKRTHL